MSEEFDNRGQISLWKNTTDNPNAPAAKGHFIAHRDIRSGEQISVKLWKNQSGNQNAPVMRGKIEDKYVKDGFTDAPAVADSDDIPF